MCGIYGYAGKGNAANNIVEGLKRLEYRGYDSWGVAVLDDKIESYKSIESIGDSETIKHLPHAAIGIGHTRWATHGGVNQTNAHPHFSTDKSFVLAQNGIVENYQDLKKMLVSKGYEFESETDTEIIVRLIEEKLKSNPDKREAVREAFLDLHGRNTIILLDKVEQEIIAVRNGSPLVVGVGDDEYFFASDTLSFADKTDKAILMNDNQIVVYRDSELKLYDVNTDSEIDYKVEKLDNTNVLVDKEGYDHFMMKEIVEQKHTIREAIQYSEEELSELVSELKKATHIYTVGSGTASYSAGMLAYFLRKYAGLHVTELKAYESGSYKDGFTDKDIIIAVSQSGETADTIEALEYAKDKGAKVASIVNMIGSTITRMSDFAFLSRSGPEICVVSTKAFTAQMAWSLLVAKTVVGKYSEAKNAITTLSKELEKYFSDETFIRIISIAEKIEHKDHDFVLGKGQNYYIALEGGLKLKETAYKHAEGFAAGELKHGVIALIEQDTPVFVIVSEDEHKDDLLSAAAEVKARGAKVFGIAPKDNELFDEFIPIIDAGIAAPIANVIPFQLLSYYLAVKLNLTPDKPRNLAKSVTVK